MHKADRFAVIVNPLAGRGFGARSIPQVQRLLSMHGLDFDVAVTARAGEAISLAEQAVRDDYGTVVAVGGDGTFQEVINGMLAASNGELVGNLGILPVGSGNDFAWSVGVPADLEGACARLTGAQTKVVDVGRITVDGVSRYFDNTVGIGFEGVVTVEARKFKRLRGLALYLPTVIKSVFVTMRAARSVISYEDGEVLQRREGDFLMVDVCNGGRAGGSFFIAPQAENDDGMFDLCLVEDIPRLRMLALIPHFLKGTHVHQPDVITIKSRRMVIRSPDSLIAHADGELLCTDAHHIECEVVPQRIRVVC